MGLLDSLLGHGSEVATDDVNRQLAGVLAPGEEVRVGFKVFRDLMIFTDRRMILIDRQGVTGRKVEYLTVPYRAITAFSVENAGTFDLDSELKIWTSGRSEPIQRTLKKGTDVLGIQQAIAASLK